MIRIAICDDDVQLTGEAERRALSLGQSLQQKLDVTVFFSGEEFFKHLDESGDVFDIVLMDIEMREISGVDAGRRLRDDIAYDQTLLIYISSHHNYYKKLIDLNVFAFISKSFNLIEFNAKLAKAIEKVLNRRFLSPLPDFVFEISGEKTYVPMKSIMFIESDKRKIKLQTTVRQHSFYGKLDDVEKQLPKDIFWRISKSYIICFAHMSEFTSRCVVISGQKLNISEKYREATKLAYMSYRGGLL